MSGVVEGAEVVFRLDDPDHELTGVRLWQELGIPDDSLDFREVDGGWELRLPRPTAHRMEYLFEVRDGDDQEVLGVDPANPQVVDGAFGTHSVLELPGYTEPSWAAVDPVPSVVEPLVVAGTVLGAVQVSVWSPADADTDEPLPLLVAHDGPEFAGYADLTQYVGAGVADKTLPRLRLALVAPGDRNAWYSADPDYSAALVHRVLPGVREAYACAPDVVLMGASLGALAALHAEWSHPGTFAGLFCQSGSFFTLDTDPQEREFSGFGAVTAFVGRVLAAEVAPSRPAVGMTAGSAEENVHNNRVMAAALSELGLDVSFAENPDAHNFTAWRDTFDPHLTALLQRVWG